MRQASLLAHARDILILPFTVTVIVPWYIMRPGTIEGNIAFKIAGIVVGLVGLAFFLCTIFLFRNIAKGTLAPWSPKQKLVVAGPYRYCRNPMITGVLFILGGEAMFFDSYNLLIWMLTFFCINTIYFFIYEEPDLEARFAKEYRLYQKHVPRRIPRLTPFKLESEFPKK
jgi:protein-S-isoprenylcysteine O-methyltransferase Ste14